MNKSNTPAAVTLWINRGVGLLMAVLLFTLPALLRWYVNQRYMTEQGSVIVSISFYCCAVVIAVALWVMDALLRAIVRGEVFVRANVNRIRRIRLCCGIVALLCLPAATCYPALFFLSVIMGFLCLAVNVVASVMDAAVTIREENDLTI